MWTTSTRHIGRTVHVYDRVESTNTLALELASDASCDGLVLLAREQTGGRGQHGRSWLSPPGSSVLLSVVLFPPDTLCRPVLMTALAAVSVCETVERLVEPRPSIKWPNDVLLAGKKVCGILIEKRLATVIGVGLNVTQSSDELRDAGLTEATSLFAAGGRKRSRRRVAELLCRKLDGHYQQLLAGNTRGLEARWKGYLGLEGRKVEVEHHDGSSLCGQVLAVGFDGVTMQLRAGAESILPPETVRHLTPRDD
jgi:BirA family biotin operon repressor/biotin-[acetyl-CoA-carboxylase] ligase